MGIRKWLCKPQKGARLTGAQILCPWGTSGASEAQKGDLVPAPCGLVLGAFLGRDPLSLTHRIHVHQRSAGVRLDWKVTHSPQRTSLSSEEGVQHRPLTSVSPRLQWKPWHLSGCDAPKVEFSKEELPGVFIFPG